MPNHFRPTQHRDKLNQPAVWKKPRIIFVCSMGDLFHRKIDVDGTVYDSIMRMIRDRAPQHTYLLLTKRPEKLKWVAERIWQNKMPSNLWIGVTAENQQRADERIPILLQIPAAVRWVSVEPMLGPVDLSKYLGLAHADDIDGLDYGDYGPWWDGLDWVVCGGETGPDTRLMQSDWARSLRDQCAVSRVPYFFKKHGDRWCKSYGVDPKSRENHELDGAVHENYPVAQ